MKSLTRQARRNEPRENFVASLSLAAESCWAVLAKEKNNDHFHEHNGSCGLSKAARKFTRLSLASQKTSPSQF